MKDYANIDVAESLDSKTEIKIPSFIVSNERSVFAANQDYDVSAGASTTSCCCCRGGD